MNGEGREWGRFISEAGDAGFEEGDEFVDAEVCEDFAVVVHGGGFGLTAEGDHFLHGFAVTGDDDLADGDFFGGEPVGDFLAPWAARFEVEDGEVGVGHGGLLAEVGVGLEVPAVIFVDGLGFFGVDAFGGGWVVGEGAEAAEEVAGDVFEVGEDLGGGIALELTAVADFAAFDADGDDAGIAEEIVEVSEGFLVSADEEDAHHVGVIVLEGVEGDGGLFAFIGDEGVEDPFAVAGDVGDDGVAGGLFCEPVDGGDWEELADGPDVWETLEHGEVAVVEVGESGAEPVEFFDPVGAVGDLGEDIPVDLVAEGAFAEGDLAGAEEGEEFFAVEEDVVVGFADGEFVHVLDDLHHGAERVGAAAGEFGELVFVGDAVYVEDIEDEDAVVGDDGAAGFGDDVWVGDIGFVHDLLDGFDEVGAVLAERVVHAVFVGHAAA